MRVSLSLLCACLWLCQAPLTAQTIALEWYGIPAELPEPRLRIAWPPGHFNQRTCTTCPTRLECLHASWLAHPGLKEWYGQLERLCSRWQLNDWLWFRLACTAIEATWQEAPSAFRQTMLWHVMARSGYDAWLTWNDEGVQVFVRCVEEPFEVPVLAREGAKWVSLSWLSGSQPDEDKAIFLADFLPPRGRAFSFLMDQQPALPPLPHSRTLRFEWQGRPLSVTLQYDARWAAILNELPVLPESLWFDIPLSQTLEASLRQTLTPFLAALDAEDRLHFLLALCRNGLPYLTDEQQFGGSRPMAADQVLDWPAADCEDKAAFFFQLNRLFLKRAALALSWPDHVSVALDWPATPGASTLRFDNRTWTICDPTHLVRGGPFLTFPSTSHRLRTASVIARWTPSY